MSAEEAPYEEGEEEEAGEEEVSEEQKAAIVRSFLLQAPPVGRCSRLTPG